MNVLINVPHVPQIVWSSDYKQLQYVVYHTTIVVAYDYFWRFLIVQVQCIRFKGRCIRLKSQCIRRNRRCNGRNGDAYDRKVDAYDRFSGLPCLYMYGAYDRTDDAYDVKDDAYDRNSIHITMQKMTIR